MAEPPSMPEPPPPSPPPRAAISAQSPPEKKPKNSQPSDSYPPSSAGPEASGYGETLAPTSTSQLESGTFSKLLVGAISSAAVPILAVPVDAARIPVVAVPCIIAPATLLDSPGFTGQFAMTHQAVLATVTAQAQLQLQLQAAPPSTSIDASTTSSPHALVSACSPLNVHQTSPPALEYHCCKPETELSASPRQKPKSPRDALRENSCDGFSWRKYGQKQVKRSDSSRSYYKCASALCSAKKKVQHFEDGRVIEIVYKGSHNHDQPRKTRFSREKRAPPSETCLEIDKLKIPSGGINRKNALPSKPEENYGKTSPEQHVHCSSDCEEDAGVKIEDHGCEPDSKKRVTESSTPYSNQQLKIVRESKVVVESRSCTGFVSDGYKWRKYGQKFVKGNPNPRSYYRCTQYRCPVRRHVQKSLDEAQKFLVTYEGKHNHEQPSPRNGIHSSIPLAATPDGPKKTVEDAPNLKPMPESLPVRDEQRENKGPWFGSEETTESAETHSTAERVNSESSQQPIVSDHHTAVSIHDS